MSLNWVMLHESQGFVRLPGEKSICPPFVRITFALTTPASYPGQNPLSVHSSSGTLFLTNQRIIFLPEKSSPDLNSFSAPLLNLHDSRIVVPWFGPNAWQAIVQPVSGGNIPPGHTKIEVKLTFKEGGALDFQSNFERIKERLQQAVETMEGSRRRQNGYLGGVNMDAVHLDQLPTYEASGQDPVALNTEATHRPGAASMAASSESTSASNPEQASSGVTIQRPAQEADEPPIEAPPGYEETQRNSIQAEMDRRLPG